jgi:hypothetical protein
VYSQCAESEKQKVFDQVKTRFGIEVDASKVTFVLLEKANILRPELYPTATLLW